MNDEDVQHLLDNAVDICNAITALSDYSFDPAWELWATINIQSAAEHRASLRASVSDGNPIGFLAIVSSIVTDCIPLIECPPELVTWAAGLRAQANQLATELRRDMSPVRSGSAGQLTSDALYDLSDSLLRIAPTVDWPAGS